MISAGPAYEQEDADFDTKPCGVESFPNVHLFSVENQYKPQKSSIIIEMVFSSVISTKELYLLFPFSFLSFRKRSCTKGFLIEAEKLATQLAWEPIIREPGMI